MKNSNNTTSVPEAKEAMNKFNQSDQMDMR